VVHAEHSPGKYVAATKVVQQPAIKTELPQRLLDGIHGKHGVTPKSVWVSEHPHGRIINHSGRGVTSLRPEITAGVFRWAVNSWQRGLL
jgi:hypothetical protein